MDFSRLTSRDVESIRDLLTGGRLSTGESNLDLHSRDESHHPAHRPDLVVWPRASGEVAAVVRYASQKTLPVTPWCGGTSLEGNPIPVAGGIVLDFTEMNRIIEIRPQDLQVDVEPGVPFRDLNRALRPSGLFFPPDPGASACVGGMIGNNASGIQAVAYGATRDAVLGLDVVMADGQEIRLGSRAIKSSSGYDLMRLVVGSEGTLGIVTRATLRLRGLPPDVLTMVATFSTVHDASSAVSEVIRAGLNPAAMELMDERVVREINLDQGLSLDESPMLFMEFHNINESALADQAAMVEQVIAGHGVQGVRRGIGGEERSRLWEARYAALDSIKRNHRGMSLLIADTCVPISRYAEMVAAALAAMDDENATGFLWGHAGDGNLHLGLLYPPDDTLAYQATCRVNQRVVEAALALGGTSTGEHGIGLGKLEFVAAEHGASLEYMRRIKQALDPQGILNPGKMIPGRET